MHDKRSILQEESFESGFAFQGCEPTRPLQTWKPAPHRPSWEVRTMCRTKEFLQEALRALAEDNAQKAARSLTTYSSDPEVWEAPTHWPLSTQAKYYELAALVHKAAQRHEDTAEAYEDALMLAQKAGMPASVCGVLWHKLADSFVAQALYQEAVGAFQYALLHKRTGADTEESIAHTLYAQGAALWELEQHDQAAQRWEEALALLAGLAVDSPLFSACEAALERWEAQASPPLTPSNGGSASSPNHQIWWD